MSFIISGFGILLYNGNKAENCTAANKNSIANLDKLSFIKKFIHLFLKQSIYRGIVLILKEPFCFSFFPQKRKNSSLGTLLQRWCINMQTANFLGDTLAERWAFTFNRTYYFFSPKYSPVRWKIGLGGYRRNEPQSICMSVHTAISKRI